MRVNRVGAHFLYFLSVVSGSRAFPRSTACWWRPSLSAALVSPVSAGWAVLFLFGLSSKALMCKDKECEAFPSSASTGTTRLLFHNLLAFMVGGSRGELPCLDDLGTWLY